MTRGADLERIRAEGKPLRTHALLVRVRASPQARVRAGIVVPRYGHSAVQRNTVKRRLRELVRQRVLPLPLSLDVVIWAQRAAYSASFDQLAREIEQVGSKLQRLGAPSS